MTDLITFLNARLDEDEQAADALAFACRLPDKVPDFFACGGPAAEAYWRHFDPARTLHEVAAKRVIVALHANGGGGLRDPREDRITYDYHVDVCEVCGPCPWPSEDKSPYRYVTTWGDDEDWPTFWPCRTLRILAAIYSDHPDYRQEWALAR